MPTTPADRTSAALRELATALDATVAELAHLRDRARVLLAQMGDRPLTDLMAAEERPLIISKLVEITDRLHETGGAVRRAEALQLRAEGRTQEEIAQIFGVTRQRVAKLLESPEVKPAAKRPRPPR